MRQTYKFNESRTSPVSTIFVDFFLRELKKDTLFEYHFFCRVIFFSQRARVSLGHEKLHRKSFSHSLPLALSLSFLLIARGLSAIIIQRSCGQEPVVGHI